MSIVSAASGASAWRGYEYFQQKKVLFWQQTGECKFEGAVTGSRKEAYHVVIDTEHPTRSTCDCPHAEGKKIVCKHKVALFFTIFPNEADQYIAEIEACRREEEEREEEHYRQIVKYVKSLSKEELREALIDALLNAEERESYWEY